MELRRRSVKEYNKLRDTGGGEDSGESNVLYAIRKTQDIDERKFEFFERLAYQTRKSDEN